MQCKIFTSENLNMLEADMNQFLTEQKIIGNTTFIPPEIKYSSRRLVQILQSQSRIQDNSDKGAQDRIKYTITIFYEL